MTRPPGDADRAPKRLAMLPEHAGKLQQGSISRGIVADADIPAVVMTVQEHKFVWLLLAPDLDHWHLLRVPTFLHRRYNAGTGSRLGSLNDSLPIGIADGRHRDRWFARQVVEIRRAPNRRADAPVDVCSGIDGDCSNGTLLLKFRYLRGKGESFRYDDLAADALGRAKGRLSLGLGEQRAD